LVGRISIGWSLVRWIQVKIGDNAYENESDGNNPVC
jgi:hypothetical protein